MRLTCQGVCTHLDSNALFIRKHKRSTGVEQRTVLVNRREGRLRQTTSFANSLADATAVVDAITGASNGLVPMQRLIDGQPKPVRAFEQLETQLIMVLLKPGRLD